MATDTSRAEFEKEVRQLGVALFLAYEQGRGYIDPDTWKAFAMWQAAERLTRERIAAAIEEKYSGGNCGAVVWRMVDIYDGLDWLAEEIRRADL